MGNNFWLDVAIIVILVSLGMGLALAVSVDHNGRLRERGVLIIFLFSIPGLLYLAWLIWRVWHGIL